LHEARRSNPHLEVTLSARRDAFRERQLLEKCIAMMDGPFILEGRSA